MSIFSRKSKSGQSQVNGKQNGHAYPRGSKSANSASVPNGGIPDPIVQRMAAQAESRKRMMSETPDYSIKSVPSGASTPVLANGGGSLSSPAEYERQASGAPQDAPLSRTATADFSMMSIGGNGDIAKPPRGTNKLRKSSATMTTQIFQMPFSNGTADPDRQKMRMPPREKGYPTPSPQTSRDSGYASVARTSTMDSPTQMSPNAPQDPELLRRHRQINASLPVREDETSKGRTLSLPASQAAAVESKVPSLPATPTTVDSDKRDSKTYVSRLDPGSASSSFLSSPVLMQQPSKPKRKEVPTAAMSRPQSEGRGSQVVPTSTNESNMSASSERSHQRQKSSFSKRPDEPIVPASDTSRPRESYYRRSKLEQQQQQQSRTAPAASLPLGSPPEKRPIDPTLIAPTQDTYVGQAVNSRDITPTIQNGRVAKSMESSRGEAAPTGVVTQLLPLGQVQVLNTKPHSTKTTTPYETPKESRSPSGGSPPNSSPPQTRGAEPVAQVAQPANVMNAQEEKTDQTDQTPVIPPINESTVLGPGVDIDRSVPMNVTTAAPQSEFPYLDGIEQGPTAPDLLRLEGYKVNRRGHILDEEGDVIGELTDGEIVNCVRRKVNGQGEIVNDIGEVVGHARPLAQGVLSPIAYDRQETSGSMVDFYHNSIRSPISPETPRDRRGSASTYHTSHQSQQSNGIVERTPITAASDTNTFVFELDASTESQAVPVIDHSEIFSPFGGSQSQRNSRSATSLTDTSRRKRRQSNPSHTPSASQERMIADARRNSKRFTASGPLPSTSQHERQRSYSTVVKAAPKGVLGPTWESLLDTVPVNKPAPSADMNGAVVTPAPQPQPSVRSQASYGAQPDARSARRTSVGEVNGTVNGQPRRKSQIGVNPRASTHAPFAKSPLASVGKFQITGRSQASANKTLANTPPGTAPGPTQGDDAFRRQLMGGMPTAPATGTTDNDDDGDSEAAPAPIIMKRTAPSTKSGKPGVKRKSFFGIPIGRKEVVTVQ